MAQPTPYMSPTTRFRVSSNLRDLKLAGAMRIDPNSDAFATIRLQDGRSVAFLEVGTRGGPIVIHCHGSGSSRLEVLVMEDAADELGIHLIGLDRPGIGRSDFYA